MTITFEFMADERSGETSGVANWTCTDKDGQTVAITVPFAFFHHAYTLQNVIKLAHAEGEREGKAAVLQSLKISTQHLTDGVSVEPPDAMTVTKIKAMCALK